MTKSAPSNSLGSNWLAANKQLANQREQTNKLLNGLSNWRQLHEILLLLSDWRLETGDWRLATGDNKQRDTFLLASVGPLLRSKKAAA